MAWMTYRDPHAELMTSASIANAFLKKKDVNILKISEINKICDRFNKKYKKLEPKYQMGINYTLHDYLEEQNCPFYSVDDYIIKKPEICKDDLIKIVAALPLEVITTASDYFDY